MLIVPVKEGDSIDRALKKYKKKFEKVGMLKQIRARQFYTKPSITKRETKLNAVYKEKMFAEE